MAVLFKVAGLPRSTFYYQAKALQAGDKYADLKARIRAVYERHRGRYGYRRVTAELRRDDHVANRKTVQRLMQALGLKSLVRPKKYRSYRGPASEVAPNLLQRKFRADGPNQKWVTDITEFNVRGERLYLSPIMDLYNGEIVAYHMDRRSDFQLIGGMLTKALAKLSNGDVPLLHSGQYQMSAISGGLLHVD